MVASMDGPLSTGHRTLLITVSATTHQENTDENEWHQETRKKERSGYGLSRIIQNRRPEILPFLLEGPLKESN